MKQLHHKYFVQGVKAFELERALSDFPADKEQETVALNTKRPFNTFDDLVFGWNMTQHSILMTNFQLYPFFPGASFQRCGSRWLLVLHRYVVKNWETTWHTLITFSVVMLPCCCRCPGQPCSFKASVGEILKWQASFRTYYALGLGKHNHRVSPSIVAPVVFSQ